jgi:uncharacterized ferritin-like protein (DUF455 family)
MSRMELRRAALAALATSEPDHKLAAVERLPIDATTDADARIEELAGLPGRPDRPRLVAPSNVPTRNSATIDGRIALLHSIAHIEFNAINLALDAIWRFPRMPERYYLDWRQVAQEEARHFGLLTGHLAALGASYGDLDAHDGLWQMAERTRGDPLARMALVPRTLEARGLDVTPAIQAKFAACGDTTAVEILDVILRDEIGHVAIGNRWFRHLCAQRGEEPMRAYAELADRYGAPRPRGPFNLEARRLAGFDSAELDALSDLIPPLREQKVD